MNQDLQPSPPFRVIPVIDLQGGQAVHARGGDRRLYQPVSSRLTPSSDPVAIAVAFRDVLGLDSLYVADLDAIVNDQPDWNTLARLASLGMRLWVDAGVRNLSRVDRLAEQQAANDSLVSHGVSDEHPRLGLGPALPKSGYMPSSVTRGWVQTQPTVSGNCSRLVPKICATSIILATETLPSLALIAETVMRIGPERIVLGVDLRGGRPLGTEWIEPLELVGRAVILGIRRVLLLDVAQVGTGRGVGTLGLLEQLTTEWPIEVVVGGGVGTADDLTSARLAGATGVLVGSALHDGRISAGDLAQLRHSATAD